MKSTPKPPCSDAALKAKTGRDWSEWCDLLDADAAKNLKHKELAELIDSKHDAGSWWSQTVAVGYERLSGKRSVHERSDSTFTLSTSKTLPISADIAHAFFVDKKKRARWLKEDIVIRTATAPKSVRITWPDNTSVAIWITAKDETKCSIAVEHTKLKSQAAVAPLKQFWKDAFQKLAKAAT